MFDVEIIIDHLVYLTDIYIYNSYETGQGHLVRITLNYFACVPWAKMGEGAAAEREISRTHHDAHVYSHNW